jgi:hypothetical protein
VRLLNVFADAVIAAGDKTVVTSAIRRARRYYYKDNKDLAHLVSCMAEASGDRTVKAAARELTEYIGRELVIANRAPANSHGISISVISTSANYVNDFVMYYDLAFSKTKWPDLMLWALE